MRVITITSTYLLPGMAEPQTIQMSMAVEPIDTEVEPTNQPEHIVTTRSRGVPAVREHSRFNFHSLTDELAICSCGAAAYIDAQHTFFMEATHYTARGNLKHYTGQTLPFGVPVYESEYVPPGEIKLIGGKYYVHKDPEDEFS